MSGIYIPNIETPNNCCECPFAAASYCKVHDYNRRLEWGCILTRKTLTSTKRNRACPLIPVPDHGDLFDVNQFEKGCFYGYGHDGRVYKLFWDERVFDGAKKFYINPIIPATAKEDGE